MRAYPALFTPELEGGFTVTFRDVPEAITCGETKPEAALMAVDALETALSFYVERRAALPVPSSPTEDERIVPLSALGMAKAALYDAMVAQNVGRAELARRLGWHLVQVQRALDFTHASKLEQIEAALAALGLRIIVETAKAA